MVAGGVDLLWVETMSDEAEVKTAVAAARATGLPVVCTMSFDTHQRTIMGVAPSDFPAFWATGDGAPNALGANCGIGPAEALDTVLDIAAAAPSGDLAVKCNCGVPFIDQGQVCYRAAPATMADYACSARDAGARIIGGCCGTGPLHVAAMAAALADRAPGGWCDRAVSRPFLVCRGTWRARPRHVGIGGGGDKSHGDTKNLAILTKWLQNTRLGGGPTFGVALYTVTKRSITRVGESSAGFGGLDGEKRRASRIGDEFGDHAGDRGRAAGR